jgi:hypothetical protein
MLHRDSGMSRRNPYCKQTTLWPLKISIGDRSIFFRQGPGAIRTKRSRFNETASMFMCLDHIANRIINAGHGIM